MEEEGKEDEEEVHKEEEEENAWEEGEEKGNEGEAGMRCGGGGEEAESKDEMGWVRVLSLFV